MESRANSIPREIERDGAIVATDAERNLVEYFDGSGFKASS